MHIAKQVVFLRVNRAKSPLSRLGQYGLARIRFWHGSERRSTTGNSCPRFGRIPFAAGCFRTSIDVVEVPKARVIPRKLPFDVVMQNAQNVFESLQGYHFFGSRPSLGADAAIGVSCLDDAEFVAFSSRALALVAPLAGG